MPLRHPIAHRRRHQKHLLTVNPDEPCSHAHTLPTSPDETPLFPTASAGGAARYVPARVLHVAQSASRVVVVTVIPTSVPVPMQDLASDERARSCVVVSDTRLGRRSDLHAAALAGQA